MVEETSGVDGTGRSGESSTAPEQQTDGRVTRRRLLASGAVTWVTASLSGCQYITDPGTDEPDDTATPTVTTETTTTDEPVGQPTPTPTTGNGTDNSSDATASEDSETPSATPTATPSPTPTPTPPPTTTSCASIGRFSAGMEVGLHVSVYDPETGEALGDDALQVVTVEFPDAEYGPLELNWTGDHEAYSSETWGTKIATDPATEPGTYRYEVTVESDDVEVEGTVSDQFTVV